MIAIVLMLVLGVLMLGISQADDTTPVAGEGGYYVAAADGGVLWQESNGVPGLQTHSHTDGDGNTVAADTKLA